MKSYIPALFLALKNKETLLPAKIFKAMTVAYALSTVDFIPDFIPVLGYSDDLIILPALSAMTIKFITKEVLALCRKEALGMWENGEFREYTLILSIKGYIIYFYG